MTMREFRSSFVAASTAMKVRVYKEAHLGALADRSFDVVGYANRLDWESWNNEIQAGWVAAIPLQMIKARDDEYSACVRMQKVAHAVVSDMANQMAVEWIDAAGLDLAIGLSQRSRNSIIDVIAEGIRNGRSITSITEDMVDSVGLDPRLRRAVSNMRSRLKESGMKGDKLDNRVEAYREKLIDYRARLIARTEVVTARNEGRMQAWTVLQDEGKISQSAMREWVVSDEEASCKICIELQDNGPVPLNQPFESKSIGQVMHPVAHPGCGCAMRLVEP